MVFGHEIIPASNNDSKNLVKVIVALTNTMMPRFATETSRPKMRKQTSAFEKLTFALYSDCDVSETTPPPHPPSWQIF